MFRRTKSEEPAPSAGGSTAVKPGGKGRPTPTRREAEAAARARAKAAKDKKAAARLSREKRSQQASRMREAMKTGDERYLPARDQGPVRRFVRDRVDARLSVTEFLLPLLIVIMALTYSSNPGLQSFGAGLQMSTVLLVIVDVLYLVWRLKRDLRQRFPNESTKGAVAYGVLRTMQLRFLRLPKPRVKVGQQLPQRY